MSEPTHDLLRRQDGKLLHLVFNRPQKKNAFTHAMYDAAADALERAQGDAGVRVVVMSGAGGVFTAGNDLQDFAANPPTGETSAVFRFLRALSTSDKPVLAAVDGVAIGIGTTMLLHCDYVVATPRARFSMPFVNLGLCPEGASSVLLPAAAGSLLARELLLFGDVFDAATAEKARLVSRLVPEGELEAHVLERARVLAAKPLGSLVATKRLLRAPHDAAVQGALAREGELFVERLGSPEAAEAFSAFLEKRKPNFG